MILIRNYQKKVVMQQGFLQIIENVVTSFMDDPKVECDGRYDRCPTDDNTSLTGENVNKITYSKLMRQSSIEILSIRNNVRL